MATLAEGLRPLLGTARGIAGSLGLRPHSVSVYHVTWAGDHTGDSDSSNAETEYEIKEDGQDPKVRWLTDEQIALAATSSGATVEIGPLTPKHSVGGVELATLAGTALTTGKTLYVKITGPNHPSGSRYRVVDITAHSALHYTLKVKPS